ncbi:MAG: S9 family peptidase [Saprospiraceae bacterium]|nr:S9 family peptidase [Saprospiraceae bacterium]
MNKSKVSIYSKVNTSTPPNAERIPHVHEAHGDQRLDYYHWMRLSDEQKNSTIPDVQTQNVIDYLLAENKYREEICEHLKDKEETIFLEIKSRIKQTDMSVPYKENGYYYVSRFEENKEYAIYSRHKDSINSQEEILLNVNQLAEGYDYYALGGISVSEDNKILAYSFDTVSRRMYNINFKNLITGEHYPEEIPNTSGNMVWANDNLHVFYTIKDEALRDYKIMRHKLGSSVEEDVEVYHENDESFNCYIYKSKSKKYLIIGSGATLSDEFRILEANNPTGNFRVFQSRVKKLEYSISHYKDKWYILCNKDDAYNFKVMSSNEYNTSIDQWEEYIPHSSEVFISDISIYNEHLILEVRKDGITQIEVRFWNGDSYYIPFAESSYFATSSINPEFQTDILRLNYTSLTTPNSTYDFNVRTKEFVLLKQQEVIGSFSINDYQTERQMIKAEDGTMIPLSIVYKKGYAKNGTQPLLLYGYGSYGLSMDPQFSSSRLSLLDRGFAFAIAHVRGGQEMGRKWYEHGKFFEKKNTFTDFVNCGEWLLANNYCHPKKLYAQGGSAGGLLIGAVINLKPELWGGVIAAVPFVDVVSTMLDESIPLTTGEYDEWGNPKQKDYYDYMKSYSPYDNVEAKYYPPILITTGYHDSQVQYWEPAKWIAKLRALKIDNNPLMMYCNMETGHGGSSGRFRRLREIAMEYTFLIELSEE